jgi:Raf kinase inhibitor-like YbhB/YbcL family protein
MALDILSSAVTAGATFPARYTCEGADISPPLEWRGVPSEAQSLAIIFDDPDAPRGVWCHWVLYDIPADRDGLSEGFAAKTRDPQRDGTQGRNDFGVLGYGGPCPPVGSEHRYYFRLFALDEKLDLPPGANRQQLMERMEGHIVARAELMSRYARQP